MNIYEALALATAAAAAHPDRPATALIHDAPDARVLVFRIEPGQQVATHTNASTVLLIVLSGAGFVLDAASSRAVTAGDIVAFAPSEPHGMRADAERLVIAAVIAPRPGTR